MTGPHLQYCLRFTIPQHFFITTVCRRVPERNRPESDVTGTVIAIIGGILMLGLFFIALLKLAIYILDKRAYARYQEKMRNIRKRHVSTRTKCA